MAVDVIPMRKVRKNQPTPDLRYVADEQASVIGGVLYRQGTVVQVYWDGSGPETWTLPNSDANLNIARSVFQQLKTEYN